MKSAHQSQKKNKVLKRVFSSSFYQLETTDVARSLLGARLVRTINGTRLSGRIVETEAYLGLEDPACHTYQGRKTPRVLPMYGHGGTAYIYLIYGLHSCFNVVTRKIGVPEAVLIRAIEPLEGIDEMMRLRCKETSRDLTNGPGRLCEALAIDRSLNGHDLQTPPLWIEKDLQIADAHISCAPRIGVDYAGAAAAWSLRFYITDSACVSRAKKAKRS